MLDDFAGIHDRDFVAYLRNHPEIMRNQDNRRVRFPLEAEYQIEDLRLNGDVKRSCRLIGNQ